MTTGQEAERLRPPPTSRPLPEIAYRQKFLNLSGANSV
jgi:hypothetical protein